MLALNSSGLEMTCGSTGLHEQLTQGGLESELPQLGRNEVSHFLEFWTGYEQIKIKYEKNEKEKDVLFLLG